MNFALCIGSTVKQYSAYTLTKRNACAEIQLSVTTLTSSKNLICFFFFCAGLQRLSLSKLISNLQYSSAEVPTTKKEKTQHVNCPSFLAECIMLC